MSDAQVVWQTQMEELKNKMHGQSDEFIKDIFALVVQPVLLNQVLPLVGAICADMLDGLAPNSKVSVAKFSSTMTTIHHLIMEKLFMPVGQDGRL